MFGPGNLAVGNSVLHEFVKERGRSTIIIIIFLDLLGRREV